MSEVKTAAEIEDILSSIRRLVSQDRKQAVQPRPQILSRLVVEDRLILTAAQRVEPRQTATVTPLRRAEPVAAWPETAVESQAPVGCLHLEPAASPEPLPRLHLEPAASADALAWESELGDPAPDMASLDWSSFTFARRPMAETYAARSRAAERLVAGQTAAEPVVQPALQDDEIPPGLTQQPLSEAVEAEPVVQEEDSIFSEDVLRELVRDLIREQLQGDLGERITRNIRKLVKAKIARMVAVQALE